MEHRRGAGPGGTAATSTKSKALKYVEQVRQCYAVNESPRSIKPQAPSLHRLLQPKKRRDKSTVRGGGGAPAAAAPVAARGLMSELESMMAAA